MTLRDLVVSIDFDDIDIKKLLTVDDAMNEIEDQLRMMDDNLFDVSKEFNKMGDKATAELKGVKKETDKTAGAMDELGDEAKKTGKKGGDALDDIEDAADDAKDATKDLGVEMRRTSDRAGSLGGTVKKLVGVVAAFVAIDKIKDLGISMIETAAAVEATEAQFEQVFDGMESAAEQALGRVADETQVLSGRLKGSFLGMAAFAKTTGMDTAGALELTERATLAAADSAAFYDKSIEEVSESLQSFLKGNYANDAALGISATETTRNAAANKLFGKSFKKLSEEQKQLALLQMVEDGNKLSGALGQAAREGDGFENVVGNLKQSWKDLMANSGKKLLGPAIKGLQGMTAAIIAFDPDPVLNFLEKAMKFGGLAKDVLFAVKDSVMSLYYDTGEVADIWEALGVPPDIAADIGFIGEILRDVVIDGVNLAKDAFDVLNATIDWMIDNWDLVTSVALGFVSALAAFKIINGINTAMGIYNTLMIAHRTGTLGATLAQYGLNTAMLASPVTWIAVGIGVLVAAGVALYKNWDTVKAKAGELWQKLLDNPMLALVAGPIGGLITGGILLYKNWDVVKEKMGGAWDFIKTSAANAIDSVIGGINKMIKTINKIPGVEIPLVPKIADAQHVDGSHAAGLGRVPYDGYIAELHKDEAVLTAKQSDAMRAAGILSGNGRRPNVAADQSSGFQGRRSGGTTFAPHIEIVVQGGNGDAQTIAQMAAEAARRELEKFWRQMALANG